MVEGQRGRPRKHLQEDHHYKVETPLEPVKSPENVASEIETVEDVVENPIVAPVEDLSEPESTFIPDKEEKSVIPVTISQPKIGWKPIETAAHNGISTIVSETGDDSGTVAFWRRTRAFIAKRWQDTGYWCNSATGLKIGFIPQYWKERF